MQYYTKCEDIVLRKVYKSYFLIDICDNYENDKGELFEINEIGNFIWDCLTEEISAPEITNKIIKNIDGEVEYDEVLKDVEEFLNLLVSINYAKEVNYV